MKVTENNCEALKNSDLPIFIWGGAKGAKMVLEYLESKDITVTALAVDDQYGSGINFSNQSVLTYSEVEKNYSAYNIVCGYEGLLYKDEAYVKAHWKGCKNVFWFPDIFELNIVEPITEEYYNEKKFEFENVINALCDEISKKSLKAYLREKIEGDHKLIIPYIVLPQYFFENAPWNLKDDEVLIDCGAYDGDSIKDFIENVGKYKKIIACEPDEKVYGHLLKNIRENGWKNVTSYKIGVGEEKGILRFTSTGNQLSKISDNGEVEIQVETIDNLFSTENVTIIKMDIEGSEMKALKGAKNTIIKNRPILMICAYHRKGDIIDIYNYINSLIEDYNYYFRCHQPFPIDAVLYAVPKERIKRL